MSKTLVEDCWKLSTESLKKMGFLTGDWFNDKLLRWTTPSGGILGSVKVNVKPLLDNGCIEITHTKRCPSGAGKGILTHYRYAVELTTTPLYNITNNPDDDYCRYWFLCPMCNRRIGTIYKPPGEDYFGCRTCYNLTYASRNVNRNVWDKLLGMWLKSGGTKDSWKGKKPKG